MKRILKKILSACRALIRAIIGPERYHPLHIGRKIPEESVRQVVLDGYKTSKLSRPIGTEDYPVDFVVMWLDGSDPEWQKSKQHYEQLAENAIFSQYNSAARYRDWDIFRYWFRSVEKNAPWVRYVFLVTCGHLPKWLNVDHPKLKIVKHSDFIPQQYLPTFCANPIELNLWRIPELGEHFVFFNDDMFLMNPLKKESFFAGGLPKLYAITKPDMPYMYKKAFDYMLYNSLGIYNESFNICEVIREHPEKWFSHLYENDIYYNARTYKDGYFNGMKFPHLCVPMRKSSMQMCYERFSEFIDETSSRRFRTYKDVNRQIYHMWELLHNTFEPVPLYYYGSWFNLSMSSIERTKAAFEDPSLLCVCLNDHEGISQQEHHRLEQELINLFEKKYPEKSSFEI